MDKIETLPGARFQHGPSSDRIYLMKLCPDADTGAVIAHLGRLAAERGYGKLFAKVRQSAEPVFLHAGFRREGIVPGLYGGMEDGVFLGRYRTPERMRDPDPADIERVLALARDKGRRPLEGAPPFSIRRATPEDADALANLYREVFATYPFPIADPAYIRSTMRNAVAYYAATDPDGNVVAAASLETDPEGQNAEMTDFAALPACRGRNIAGWLLARMEAEAPDMGIRTAFTLARARSIGMNTAFARLRYRFGGTLINNTQIAGRIESMNIWYKSLPAPTQGVPSPDAPATGA